MANIELDGANKKIKVDSGDLTLDVPGDIILDADGADLVFADGGTNILKVTNSSSDVVFQPQVDAKDLKFNQYDGRTLLEVNDGGFVAIANGATGPGQLRLYEDTDNGTNYSAFQVGTQSGDITYTLPTADGSSGQVLSTNGSGTLSWATASSADPSSADGDSLGTASAEWSDLYLADGGVIYFGNDQDVTLTHDPDDGLFLKSIATGDDNPVLLTLQTGETDLAQDDVIGKIAFQAPDEATGTDAILVSAAIQAVAEGDHSSSSNATRLEFHTGSSELATSQMTISSGGIVGIGTVPTGDLGVGLHIKTADSSADVHTNADELVLENSGDCGITILSNTSDYGNIYFGDSGDNNIGQIAYNHNTNTLQLHASGGEVARFNHSGGDDQFFVHATTNPAGGTKGFAVLGQIIVSGSSSTSEQDVMRIEKPSGRVGSITATNSNAAYNTSSDYRLKENVDYTFDATTRLKQLKPARFNWIVDDTNTLQDGFLAHEVSSIVPEAITGTKDATETKTKVVLSSTGVVIEEGIEQSDWTQGKTDGKYPSNSTWEASKTVGIYQQIDLAKLVPLLVKTVQELEARIKTLEDA
jgi:hypothetical protein